MIGLLLGNWQRFVAYGVVAMLLASLLELDGYRRGEKKLWDYQAKQATEAVRIARTRDRVTNAVVTRYVKVKGDAEIVTQTITKEVVRYAEANLGYCLDASWRVLHDDAARNTVPDPGFKPDGEGGAPTAATAIQTVTGNYAACNRTADRLDALQTWVRDQSAVH